MKRPQFFEDLDRELHGEPEQSVVPSAVPDEQLVRAMNVDYFRALDDFHSRLDAEIARSAHAWAATEAQPIDRLTATGAMIAASHQYWEQRSRMTEAYWGQPALRPVLDSLAQFTELFRFPL